MRPTDKEVWDWWNALPRTEQRRRRRSVEEFGLDPNNAPFITYEPHPAPRCKHGNGADCDECWSGLTQHPGDQEGTE